MDCVNCGKKIIIKRDFFSLFCVKKEYLCDKCYSEYKFDFDVENISFGNRNLVILSLLKKRPKFSYECFHNELASCFFRYIDKGYFVLIFDELYVSINFLLVMKWLINEEKKDILIITFLKRN